MKTTTELHYTSGELCNCKSSHDTFRSEPCNRPLTHKEVVSALKSYEAHEHSTDKTLTLVFIHEDGDDVAHVEHTLAHATWNMTKQKWEFETFDFNAFEPDNIFFK